LAPRINNGQAKKHATDERAEALAATIAKIQNADFVSITHHTRAEREKDINRAGRQMALKQRQATPAPKPLNES
jgi:hypothetical protein